MGRNIETVYAGRHITIQSNEHLTRKEGKRLAKLVEDAYAADARAEGLPTHIHGRIWVDVLSAGGEHGFNALTGAKNPDVRGYTLNENRFLLRDTFLRDGSKRSINAAIAHELGHVLDGRAAGARTHVVPYYLREGKEVVLAQQRASAVDPGKTDRLREISDQAGKVTPKEAEHVVRHFRTQADESREDRTNRGGKDELVSAMFVEFLRTRLGGGKPDAVARIADVVKLVGEGGNYDRAFRSRFGVSPREAERAFVQYIEDTKGDPTARLSGTIYDPEHLK